MKGISLVLVSRSLLILFWLFNKTVQAQEHKLWYTQPAQYFEEALPVGNGKVGAMVYGGTHKERISLNDITLWTGSPVNPGNYPDAYKHLPAIRSALFNENYAAADTLVKKLQGRYSEFYAPLGNVWITFNHPGQVSAYERQLDLAQSLVQVRYTIDQTRYTRKVFVSHPDQLIAVRLECHGKNRLDFSFHMNSLLQYQTLIEQNQLIMSGRAPVFADPDYRRVNTALEYRNDKGIRFAAVAQLIETDGTINYQDTSIQVSGASYAEIRLGIATSFNGYDHDPASKDVDEKSLARASISKAAQKSYPELLHTHQKDYTSLYNRVTLNLSLNKISNLDTYTRLQQNSLSHPDPGLTELYFNFGRYLLISSSRTPEAPINLQGLWNEQMRPPWSSNYTVNINTEMNYWPVEVCNLAELHLPLLTFIKNLSKTGAVTARSYYNCRGWTVHHNTDIWAMTNPVGDFGGARPQWANWQAGGSWMSIHLWEHYLYSNDLGFLKQEAYPIMKGAALFCLDYLVEDKKGFLVTAPSTSPENLYITDGGYTGSTLYGSTADLAMMRELFKAVIQAGELLKLDKPFTDSVQMALDRLYPYPISKQGHLQEWYHDWNDREVTHRHLSHLYGVYPGTTISPRNEALFNAARKSLLRRTNNGTGWSISWKIAMWARLLDAEMAMDALQKLLTFYPADKNETRMSGGGTYPNLFDAHPPFQIDGNFGGIAGIAEMLVQSHEPELHLLPALPNAWSSGSVKGLKARGNIEVNMYWDKGKLLFAELFSPVHTQIKLKYKDQTRTVRLSGNTWTKISFV